MKRPGPACRRCSRTRPSGPRPRDAWPPLPPAGRPDSWQLLLDLVPLRLAAASDRGERPASWRTPRRARRRAPAIRSARSRGCARRCRSRGRAPAWSTRSCAWRRRPATSRGRPARSARPSPPAARRRSRSRTCMNGGGACSRRTSADLAAASESYAAALALTPERLEPRRSLLRTLVRLGRLPEAARLLVDANTSPDARDTVLLPLYESLALEAGQSAPRSARWKTPSTPRPASTRPPAAICTRASRRPSSSTAQDTDAAEGALERALAADPRHVATLLRRADLQRRHPDRRLVETLTRLAAEQPDNLDFLQRGGGDRARAARRRGARNRICSRRLCAHAGNLLARDARASGKLGAADAAAYAVDEAVRVHVASGTPDAVGVATTLLLDSARLRVPDQRRWGWLRRAAELTEGALDDRPGAIRIWRLLHEQAPEDEIAREALRAPVRGRGPLRRRRRLAGRRAGAPPGSGTPARAAPGDRSSRRAARTAEQRARRPAGQPARTAGARPDAGQAGGRPRRQGPPGGAGGHPRGPGADPGGGRRAGAGGGAVGGRGAPGRGRARGRGPRDDRVAERASDWTRRPTRSTRSGAWRSGRASRSRRPNGSIGA